jgi:chlorite dismutase
MGKKIYAVALGRMKEAWYQLSEEERQEGMAKIGKWREQDGVRTVISCDSTWATHQWEWFSVTEFPDIEAVQRHAAHCAEVDWLRYMDVTTTLGTKTSEDEEP